MEANYLGSATLAWKSEAKNSRSAAHVSSGVTKELKFAVVNKAVSALLPNDRTA
jgi:hypothetical protein